MHDFGPIAKIVEPYLTKSGRLRRSGKSDAVARCPFHNPDKHPSFSINLESGLWVCYACGERGNLHTFLSRMGIEASQIDATLEPVKDSLEHYNRLQKSKRESRYHSDPFRGTSVISDAVLGMFDFMPIGLVSRGFDADLLRSMDIGYDRRKDRITFPIRNLYGELVGISGRAAIKGKVPKYKVYKGGCSVKGEWRAGDFGEGFDEQYPGYDIDKGDHLWNSHSVYHNAMKMGSGPLIVVEGFKACIWLVQCGFENVVALMGSSMSRNQSDLISRMGEEVIIFLDNDEAGIKGTIRTCRRLSRAIPNLRAVKYPNWAKQPDDMNARALRRITSEAKEWRQWQKAA